MTHLTRWLARNQSGLQQRRKQQHTWSHLAAQREREKTMLCVCHTQKSQTQQTALDLFRIYIYKTA